MNWGKFWDIFFLMVKPFLFLVVLTLILGILTSIITLITKSIVKKTGNSEDSKSNLFLVPSTSVFLYFYLFVGALIYEYYFYYSRYLFKEGTYWIFYIICLFFFVYMIAKQFEKELILVAKEYENRVGKFSIVNPFRYYQTEDVENLVRLLALKQYYLIFISFIVFSIFPDWRVVFLGLDKWLVRLF